MKRVLKVVGATLLVLLTIVLIRAATFSADPVPFEAVSAIDVDRKAACDRLATAIRIRTVATSSTADVAPFEALRNHIEVSFPKVHTTLERERIGRHGLLYTWRGSDPNAKPVLLMAHQDVVPVDESALALWEHPPFAGVIADGYIWGRGTLDVKSGVFGILEGAEKLIEDGFRPTRTVYFSFGHDEEVGGLDGAQRTAALLRNRGVRLEVTIDEGGIIGHGLVPGVSTPVALIGVAEKGYVSLELSTKGEGGHSSMPPPNTAVGVIAQAVTRLEANPFPTHMEHSGRFFEYVGPKMPFHMKIIFANLWLFRPIVQAILSGKNTMNATIRTTTAATMFNAGVKDNVLPAEAKAIVNFRIIPGDTIARVIEYVKKTIDDPRVAVAAMSEDGKVGFGTEPSPVSDVHAPSFHALANTIRGVANDPELTVAPYLVVGATDSRYLTDISDNVYRFLFNHIGPDDIPRIHGTNERIAVDNYVQTITFYYALIKNLQTL